MWARRELKLVPSSPYNQEHFTGKGKKSVFELQIEKCRSFGRIPIFSTTHCRSNAQALLQDYPTFQSS